MMISNSDLSTHLGSSRQAGILLQDDLGSLLSSLCIPLFPLPFSLFRSLLVLLGLFHLFPVSVDKLLVLLQRGSADGLPVVDLGRIRFTDQDGSILGGGRGREGGEHGVQDGKEGRGAGPLSFGPIRTGLFIDVNRLCGQVGGFGMSDTGIAILKGTQAHLPAQRSLHHLESFPDRSVDRIRPGSLLPWWTGPRRLVESILPCLRFFSQ